ncbi:uncharacterized protein LOC143242211 [Tachypleus tridentatus]|uniref:uncharacterized protein LOC143242211 n=1 Tax=Tachypleus tridentatus TaxID=6853 RepID=UPI003FD5E4F6
MKRKKIVTRSNGKALSNDEIMDMLNRAIEGPASESLSSSTESSEGENSGAEESRRPQSHETNETSNKRRLKKKKKKDMRKLRWAICGESNLVYQFRHFAVPCVISKSIDWSLISRQKLFKHSVQYSLSLYPLVTRKRNKMIKCSQTLTEYLHWLQ